MAAVDARKEKRIGFNSFMRRSVNKRQIPDVHRAWWEDGEKEKG